MKKNILVLFILAITFTQGFSQPFVDLVNFNYQTFSSPYKDSTKRKNKTDDYFFNLFFPKEFKSGNTFLVRLSGEMINSTLAFDSAYSSKIYSASLPIGFQFVSKNKKWKTLLMAIPKIACDFKGSIVSNDWQYGGIFLETFVSSPTFKIKAGLYYNREAFGNFFVPLVGVDWKATSRISMYGILPTNYKIEYRICNKLFSGINFKALTRSFRLSGNQNYDYVRYDEEQLKAFLDFFIYKKFLLFAEAGYSLGQNPLQYKFGTDDLSVQNPVYSPLKNYFLFNFGIAYRLRFDLEEKKEN